MDSKKLLGQRIKEIRKSKGFTQEKLAETIGIETNSLSAIESGRHFPSLVTLEKISTYMEVHLQSFFEFKDESTKEEMKAKIFQNLDSMDLEDIICLYKVSEYYKNI